MIWDAVAALSIILTIGAFIWMSIVDLKIRILPDELNLLVGVCGLAFHFSLSWMYFTPLECMVGALMGGGVLLLIRGVANRIYQMETLGLGDVKLLTAVGFWLGPEHTMIALSLGAFAGLMHGIIYLGYANLIKKQDVAFRGLTIPAGPGFIVGALAVGIWLFHDLMLFAGGEGEYI